MFGKQARVADRLAQPLGTAYLFHAGQARDEVAHLLLQSWRQQRRQRAVGLRHGLQVGQQGRGRLLLRQALAQGRAQLRQYRGLRIRHRRRDEPQRHLALRPFHHLGAQLHAGLQQTLQGLQGIAGGLRGRRGVGRKLQARADELLVETQHQLLLVDTHQREAQHAPGQQPAVRGLAGGIEQKLGGVADRRGTLDFHVVWPMNSSSIEYKQHQPVMLRRKRHGYPAYRPCRRRV